MKTKEMVINLNKEDCLAIVNSNYIGHLAYLSGKYPIVIPITYFYEKAKEFIICYSSEGQKIKSMRDHKFVSLSVDFIQSVNQWKSVLIQGLYEELEGPDAKYYLHKFANGVKHIMTNKEQKDPHFISEFSSKLESEGIPIVFRINHLEFTGKQRY